MGPLGESGVERWTSEFLSSVDETSADFADSADCGEDGIPICVIFEICGCNSVLLLHACRASGRLLVWSRPRKALPQLLVPRSVSSWITGAWTSRACSQPSYFMRS